MFFTSSSSCYGRHFWVPLLLLFIAPASGQTYTWDLLQSEDEGEEDESNDGIKIDKILGFGLPAGLILLAVALYCGRHSMQHFCAQMNYKPTVKKVAVEQESWPFILTTFDHERGECRNLVVCRDHEQERCNAEGCRVDYGLLNLLSREFEEKKRTFKAMQELIEAYTENMPASHTDDQDNHTAVTAKTNLTLSIQESASLLLKDTDPCRVIKGFASICYALQVFARLRKNVDRNFVRLAFKSLETFHEFEKSCAMPEAEETNDSATIPHSEG